MTELEIEVEHLRGVVARLTQALEGVVNPVGMMRRTLPEGSVLDGQRASRLIESTNTYRSIAKEALRALLGRLDEIELENFALRAIAASLQDPDGEPPR